MTNRSFGSYDEAQRYCAMLDEVRRIELETLFKLTGEIIVNDLVVESVEVAA